MDREEVSRIRAMDKRLALVGHRKAGYCGHVPQYVYFPPTGSDGASVARSASATAASPAPGSAGHLPRPTSTATLGPSASSVPLGGGGGDGHADLPPMYPYRERPQHEVPKQIAGYCGHRATEKFRCGSTVNTQRKTDALPSQLEQQLVFPELGKMQPIPRYPVIRGPTRKSPLGWECFLTN